VQLLHPDRDLHHQRTYWSVLERVFDEAVCMGLLSAELKLGIIQNNGDTLRIFYVDYMTDQHDSPMNSNVVRSKNYVISLAEVVVLS